MQINRENYEAFMLDYLEGNLSPSVRNAFKVFLEENPDLKSSAYQSESIRLWPGPVYFNNKELLKKDTLAALDNIPEPDKSCIACIEKDLPDTEMILFREKISRESSVQQVLESYGKVLLKAGRIIFRDKKNLKKPVLLIPSRVYRMASAVAAGLLLLFLLKFFLLPLRPSGTTQMSDFSINQPAYSENQSAGKTRESSSVPLIKNRDTQLSVQHKITSKKAGLTAKSAELAIKDRRLPPVSPISSPAIDARPLVFRGSISTSVLETPVLYLTEQLGEEELRAIENYKIEKFKLKILAPVRPADTYPPLWITLANMGIKGINKLAKWNMELKPNYNEQGDLSALAFHSRFLNFSSDLIKTNPE